ncbi:MAG: hypothetical protein HY071_01790 [Chloroflexi bacterium]|nr:hypothetical protein [Chloroflexota bacterium]
MLDIQAEGEAESQELATRFLVKAAAKTAIRLPRPQRFSWEGVQVDATNWETNDQAGPMHRGLFFDVSLSAEDVKAAVVVARRLLEHLESAFAFVMAAGVSHSKPLIAFEQEEGHVTALQYEELPVIAAVRRHLDPDRLRALWDRLQACNPASRERVDRAIAWYRKGAFEDLVLDRFQSWWVALEALNPLIQAKYDLSTTGPARLCPNCGAAVPGGPVSSGTRFVIERVGGAQLWRAVSEARNDVVHARRPLGEVAAAMDALLPQLSQVVRGAVLDVLDVPTDLRPQFTGSDLSIPREYQHRVGYRFRDLKPNDIPRGQDYPSLKLAEVSAERKEVDGRIQERVAPTYKATTDPVAVFSEELEVVVDPDDAAATLDSEAPKLIPSTEAPRP